MRLKLSDFASYLPLQISQGSPEIMCSSIRFRRPEKIHDKTQSRGERGKYQRKLGNRFRQKSVKRQETTDH